MSKKKKHIKKGWLCPECQTVYAPSVKQCECVKEAAAVVTVTEGDDGELHLDWDKPMGLKIGWGKLDATITGVTYNDGVFASGAVWCKCHLKQYHTGLLCPVHDVQAAWNQSTQTWIRLDCNT